MTTKIRVLSEQTINQIAAGEVIESPASVVKELVENSLDAYAKNIQIEIVAGGFSLIKIADDGEGMTHDDAILSLERHATSKIRSAEDLFSIATMGFRGEALASIASISKMHLLTAKQGENEATSIFVEGGKCINLSKGSRTHGTTFEIRSLFFTTPARKKFQKNPAQATADIHKILIHIALCRPDVSFSFMSNHELIFCLQAENLAQRAKQLIGESFLKEMKPFSKDMHWLKVEGMLSLPGFDRPNRLGQYIFVNKRPVLAPQISMAVQEAYATMLEPRRFPLFILDISLRPDLIDVNVHPQKKEIRFKEDAAIKNLLREEINKHLNYTGMQQLSLRPLTQPSSLAKEANRTSDLDVKEVKCFAVKQPSRDNTQEPMLFEAPIAPKVSDLIFIGIFQQYALIDTVSSQNLFDCEYLPKVQTGFLMIDLFGISQRLYYEKALVAQESLGFLEQLLFPIKIQATPKESAILQENINLLKQLGIQLSPFGKNLFVVEALDKSIDEDKVENFLREFLAQETIEIASLLAKKEKLAMQACKYLSSRKKNYTLDMAKLLITKFLQLKLPFYTPEGKKIIGCIHEGIYGKGF